MERAVVCQAQDLPPDQRHAIEALLGGPLPDKEFVSVKTGVGVIRDAAAADERERAFASLFELMDRVSQRVEHVPDEEIDDAIQEACDHVRHHRE
jgi:hypothetical protein